MNIVAKEVNSKKQLFFLAIAFTMLFYIFANGQRFFSSSYSGDSLLMIFQNDSAWQIALGRFMHPILIMFRGGMVSPFLISVLTLLWMSLAVFFLVDFLEMRNMFSIFSVAAVMTCNITLLATNATFLQCADFYALALLCAVLGVWLLNKGKWVCTIAGILAFSISMGIYQSYICVAIALIMIHFIFELLQKVTFRQAVKKVIFCCIALLAGAVIYYIMWKIFQNIFDIWTADSYNGLANMGDYSGTSIFSVIATTYRNVFYHFWNPDTFITMPFRGVSLSIVWVYLLRLCNIAVVVLTVLGLVLVNRKEKTTWWQRLLQVLVVVLFPVGINFVCVISKGMEHSLMIYAFCLVYVLGVRVAEATLMPGKCKGWSRYLIYATMLLMLFVVSWSNIIYSNQVYMKKDLQEKATHSMMTRIVYEIESTEGYESGVTPVAFLGSFEATDYVPNLEPFKDLLPYGMGKSVLTYTGTEYSYLTYILNTNMNLTRVGNEAPVIQQMPTYPTKGSVQMVDGVVVVKISE